ncbi:Uncharacterised protein [Citrobacter youngae]|uniref:Uncharacterized protein n=1 Tax=Citrobacter youngae TaxID=133448 RepID=A0ABM8MF99_9ENTR|nr:hypothetical protein [Citrobacter youngae]EIQ7157494.1 hypothetical protein [Citrobacter sedlakii]CAB5540333.1 Uncharacterised protein [Citrobacter youngae]CAC9106133.1 Uncharacterised protein [Citrobacter youngae]
MPSHHRITINLPTRKFFSDLKGLAQKRDFTLSKLILEIIIAGLRFDASSARFLEELRNELKEGNAGEKSFTRDETHILHGTSIVVPNEDKDTSDAYERIILKAHECHLREYEFTIPDLSSKSEFDPKARRKMSDDARTEVLAMLRAFIIKEIPVITQFMGGTPDFLHLFVKKAIVQYDKDNDLKCNVRILTTLHVLPLFFNDVANSRLDFPEIRFRQFKTLAVDGWDKNKYERMVYIERASGTKSGGYFIGLDWNKRDSVDEIYEGYEMLKIGDAEKQKDMRYKVHMHSRDVKFKNTPTLSSPKKDNQISPL